MATIMNNMIDIHNHSLPGVDDGAKTMEEAVQNLKYLKSKGFNSFVLTSHYIVNTEYSSNVKKRYEILEQLKHTLNDDEIKLYIGNEVYVNRSEVLIDLLKSHELTTLNGSRYMLIELPLNQRLRGIETVLCELNEAGIVPVIAHPERYAYIQKNYDKIYDLLEFDCRLQVNLTSLVGYYGKGAKKVIKKLLKEGLVSFIATDFHHIHREDYIQKAFKKLKRYLSDEEIKNVLEKNQEAMLKNETVPSPSLKYRKYQ